MLDRCRWSLKPALSVKLSALAAILLIFQLSFHFSLLSVTGRTLPRTSKAPNHRPIQVPALGTVLAQAEAPVQESASVPAPAHMSCSQKPNLILSAINGPGLLDQIFPFMASLDTALGIDMVTAQREGKCLPAPVEVKIIAPPGFTQDLPDSYRMLLRRHKNLEFLDTLPVEITDIIVYSRFIAWARLVDEVGSSYHKILNADLDIIFQRDPFSMTMEHDVELLFFAEWRGFKLGQDRVHINWFKQCSNTSHGPYITEAQFQSYANLDRIIAGSTYGTSRAMAIYLDTMAAELTKSHYECNDQAIHTHIYYSGEMQAALNARSAGRVWAVPNDEAILGNIGTSPYVQYNEWGEMMNDLGEVLVLVHQFKWHDKLAAMVARKYGWQAELATSFPTNPLLIRNEPELSAQTRFTLAGVDKETCNDGSLCSCRWADCQFGAYP